MDGKLLIGISDETLNEKANLDILIEATNTIINTTEKDFETIKNKEWYKRFWELITFSQDNNKLLAKGVNSLAQMQDIVIKVLLMLYKKNNKIHNFVTEQQYAIDGIIDRIYLLENEILSMKKALSSAIYYSLIKISEIDYYDKGLIGCALYKYSLQHPANKISQSYNRKIEVWLDLKEGIPKNKNFDYASLEELDIKSGELLFTKICEMTLIYNKSNSMFNKRYQKAIEYINISNPKKKEIWEKISNYVKNTGKEWLVQKFDDEALPSYYVDSNAIELMNPYEEIWEYYDEISNNYVPEEEEQEGKLNKSLLDRINKLPQDVFSIKKIVPVDLTNATTSFLFDILGKIFLSGQKSGRKGSSNLNDFLKF